MNTHLGTPLSNEEVDLLEARMDTEFENTPLPGTNIYQTRWAICTVGEDIHRFAILKAAQDWYKPENRQVQSRLIARVDRYKYELRHALDLCEKKLSHTEITSSGKIDEKSYEVAGRLFHAADQFAYATRVFSSYRSGFSQFYRDTNCGVIRLNRTGRNIAYYVLEYMAQADSSEINPLWIVAPPFAGPAVEVPEDNSVWEWSDTIHAIVRRAKIKTQISNIKSSPKSAASFSCNFSGKRVCCQITGVYHGVTVQRPGRFFRRCKRDVFITYCPSTLVPRVPICLDVGLVRFVYG